MLPKYVRNVILILKSARKSLLLKFIIFYHDMRVPHCVISFPDSMAIVTRMQVLVNYDNTIYPLISIQLL